LSGPWFGALGRAVRSRPPARPGLVLGPLSGRPEPLVGQVGARWGQVRSSRARPEDVGDAVYRRALGGPAGRLGLIRVSPTCRPHPGRRVARADHGARARYSSDESPSSPTSTPEVTRQPRPPGRPRRRACPAFNPNRRSEIQNPLPPSAARIRPSRVGRPKGDQGVRFGHSRRIAPPPVMDSS